jgi:chemotaxis protein methyltransferase CheR
MSWFRVAECDLPKKIAFYGHFGSSNPGNEATLLAILSQLRERYPGCEFQCICTHPEVVAARDGIEATAIRTRVAKIWDRDAPLARRVPMSLAGAAAELAQYGRAFAELRGSDMLIVPGTGLVTDVFGLSSWGPYNLFKWILIAKLRRCRVLFVSIGAGPFETPLGRSLVRAATSLGDYRSFRDEPSRDAVRAIGGGSERDTVYPDLAFGLPRGLLPARSSPSRRERRVVGLGLMVYYGRYSTADPHSGTYATYLESLAVFAAWLLEHDYDIRLLLGDGDRSVIGDFRSALEAQLGGYDEDRVVDQQIVSVHDVLAELADTDVVVATRFHNVLFAMLLDKPTIAISFHHKCTSLMSQMDVSEYCHDIHQMDADRLIAQFRQLERNEQAVKRTIARGCDRARTALDEQYDLVFAGGDHAGVPRKRRGRRKLETAFLRLDHRVWRRLPARARELPPVRDHGAWLHERVRRRADREMYLGTLFLRNRPALELLRRLVDRKGHGERVTIAVLGCSIGVEVYSVLWTLRRSRPDITFDVQAIDISPEVVDVGERGVYSAAASEMVNQSIFQALTETERAGMFDWDGDEAEIKPWLREGITWQVGDAGDPNLIESLGPQDLVIASNFLCHMEPHHARRCLRILAQAVGADGHLFVSGVDLDVRTDVARELGWDPISELRAEIHDGDRLVRSDWPWQWWGLEPLDRRRTDWELRYTAVFRATARPPEATREQALGRALPQCA